MMEYELSIDPKVICRVCLAENTLKTVFCNEIVNGSILPFPKVFECVTGLKVVKDDGFPDKLCAPCRTTINESYVLQQKCKNNQTLLCGVLNITIDEPTQPTKPKVCLTIGTQTEAEKKPKGDNAITQTDWDTSCVSTQTSAHDAKTIQTQTSNTGTSIGSQTTAEETSSAECQTDEWIPMVVSTQMSTETGKATSFTSTTPEVPDEEPEMHLEEPEEEEDEPDFDNNEMMDVADDDIIDEDDEIFIEPCTIKTETIQEEVFEEDEIDDYEENQPELEPILDEIEYLMDDDDIELTIVETNEEVPQQNYCKLCRSWFGSNEELEEHLQTDCSKVRRSRKKRSTIRRDLIACKLCKYQAKSSEDLTNHLQMHKRTLPMLLDSVYYFRCGTCYAVFMTVNDLDMHLQRTNDLTPCIKSDTHESCTDYQFLEDDDDDRSDTGGGLEDASNIDSLQRICSAVRVNDHTYACNWCQEFECSSALEIWNHYADTHFQADDTDESSAMSDAKALYCESFTAIHKCGYCDQTFRVLRDSIPHVFFHASSFGCPFPSCADTYLRFHLLSYHMESRHLDNKHQCDDCLLEVDSYAQKRRHMRYDCLKRKFICSKCKKRFNSRDDLMFHNKFHMNEFRWKCKYCEKRFSQSGDLRTHERIHTGDKPYPCNLCEKTFRSVGNRRDHMATHVESAPAPVNCKVCGRTFKSERILRGHMAIHSEVKRFKCTVCTKEFYRNYHLKKHMQTHADVI